MSIAIDGNGIGVSALSTAAKAELKSGRKNLIINGAMQVAQRNTSVTPAVNGYQTVDRWYYQTHTTPATMNATQESADGPADFYYYHRVTIGTADTTVGTGDRLTFKQPIERNLTYPLNWGTSDAKDATLSFWVRSSVTGTYGVTFFWMYNGNNDSYTAEYTINAANTWEKKTITVPGQTNTSLRSTTWNGEDLQIRFHLMTSSDTAGTVGSWVTGVNTWGTANQVNVAATSGNTWDLTGVQLELGDTATDFEHRSYGEELALCQRYYQPWRVIYETSLGTTGSIASPIVSCIVPMRASPSFTTSSDAGSGSTLNSMTAWQSGTSGVTHYYMNLAISTSGYAYRYAYGYMDAEL